MPARARAGVTQRARAGFRSPREQNPGSSTSQEAQPLPGIPHVQRECIHDSSCPRVRRADARVARGARLAAGGAAARTDRRRRPALTHREPPPGTTSGRPRAARVPALPLLPGFERVSWPGATRPPRTMSRSSGGDGGFATKGEATSPLSLRQLLRAPTRRSRALARLRCVRRWPAPGVGCNGRCLRVRLTRSAC